MQLGTYDMQWQTQKTEKILQSSNPVFRKFSNPEQRDDISVHEEMIGAEDWEKFRIVSIQKLCDAPQSHQQANPFPWDEWDNFSDPWAGYSWYPEVSKNQYEDYHTKTGCGCESDSHSISAGHYTDPGAFRPGRGIVDSSKRVR